MEHENAQVRMPATMPEKFLWLTALLANKNLSASAKNVATRLMLHHNDRTGQCNPSHRRLATGLGLSEKHGRKTVCRLVGELKAGGWIEATETDSASEYRLLIDRAETIADGSKDELDGLDRRQGVSLNGDRGVPDLRQGESLDGGTEPSRKPSRETVKPNLEPAETAIELEVKGPAEQVPVMTVQPVTTPPTPANDDAMSGVEEVAGLRIPEAMFREWERSFGNLDLRAAILSRAKWALGIAESRRYRSLQTELGKLNTAAHQTRMARKDNAAADTAAGVERDPFTGRIKHKGGGIPPGANSRYYIA